MSDLKFDLHTQEKLDVINYYYKTWFKVVKRQQTNIIDAYAGTGYAEISNEKIFGSALLAADLFKQDEMKNLSLFLININPKELQTLRANIFSFIEENSLDVELDQDVRFFDKDWASVINDILVQTQNGISLYLLDPYGAKSLSWDDVNLIIQRVKVNMVIKRAVLKY